MQARASIKNRLSKVSREKRRSIADGASTDKGDLAIGRNILVAFMPWNGIISKMRF